MSARAKVFMNGRSQAIRLPKEFRVSGTEVTIERVPGGVLIRDDDPWDVCQAACEGISQVTMHGLEKRNSQLKLEHRAAHARGIGATLVSHNIAEFRRVPGLVCEDWVVPDPK